MRTDVDEMQLGMNKHLSSETLVGRAQAGDRGAFGELSARYRQRLEALVETRMGKEVRATMDVADVVQETFARALQSMERFQFQGDYIGGPGSASGSRTREGAADDALSDATTR